MINGKIYIAGLQDDQGNFYVDVSVYDPETDTWSRKSSMRHPRDGGACAIVGDSIYYFGGRWVSTRGTNYTESMCPCSLTDDVGFNLKIFIDGEKKIEVYVPRSNITTNTYDLLIGRWEGIPARNFNGYIDEIRISNTTRSGP